MKKIRHVLMSLVLLGGMLGTSAFADEEIKGLIDRLLAASEVTTEAGFSASMLVPPGELYDPLWMIPHNGTVWLNDDGGEEGDKGSRIMAVGKDGTVSVVVALGRLLPTTGYDVAPQGFGEFGGHIFALAQPEVAAPGATKNHVIQRIDPKTEDVATVVCTLPDAGDANKGVSGFGVDARFGPVGSPFANTFFAATLYNNTVYQMTADGKCTPFVILDGKPWGSPTGIAFSADGQQMFVTAMQGSLLDAPVAGGGAILSVSANGKVAEKPVVEGLARPMGISRAPASLGAYAGQLFITDVGGMEIPVPMTQALAADGKLYRATADGKPHLVASGFINPTGIQFVDGEIWVADINGDFIAGKRELPDGSIVKIQVQ